MVAAGLARSEARPLAGSPSRESARPAATRLLVAFLLLLGAFCVLIGIAVFSLVAAGQLTLAAVVTTAGMAGVITGSVTWWLLRRDAIEELEDASIEAAPAAVPTPPPARASLARRPLRVQAMPVAELPPAYVDAVIKGAQQHLQALKAGASQH